MEGWAEISRLHRAEGLGIEADRSTDMARNTVGQAPRSEEPLRTSRRRDRRARGPGAARRRRCATGMVDLRPLFQPPDLCHRIHDRPGELVQFGLWQPDVAIPLGHGQADKLGWS